LPGERDNARNNARCTQVRKTTHGLDGQHKDMDRTPVEESIRMIEERQIEKACPWCGQPSDRGRQKKQSIIANSCHCFDAVGLAAGRASGL